MAGDLDVGALAALAQCADPRAAPRGVGDVAVAAERVVAMRHGRQKAALKRALQDSEETANVVADAWNAASACTRREQAPGWHKEKGIDERTQLPRRVLEGAFETASAKGAGAYSRHTGISRSSLVDDVAVVTEVAHEEHAKLVDAVVAKFADASRMRYGKNRKRASVNTPVTSYNLLS